MRARTLLLAAVASLLLASGSGPALAQSPGRIEGKVLRPDGSGLGGVSVQAGPEGETVLTDADGGFVLEVPAGTYDLAFSLVDRTATEAGVQVAAGGTARVDKTVDWDVSFADTITVVSASRRPERITEAPAAVTVVGEAEIEREAATGQVPKLLEFTPGVDFTQSGLYDFNFNTRGFNSSLNRRILTLIDGRDPSVPFLGSQEWAAISFPLDELESVELVRGPGSALYGANAFSGVLNMTTKPAHGAAGGKLRLTGGELSTRRADFRWAGDLAAGWAMKLVGGYAKSDDFLVSRRPRAEYLPCTATSTTGCLRPEAAPLRLDEDQVGFGGLRFDRQLAGDRLLTIEGGTASIEGPAFVTGIGRVQVTDTKRPWGRANFSTVHWNVLGYYDQRKAEDQLALSSGALLFEDSSNLHGEVQGNVGFAGGRGFLVGGLAYHQQEIDTANRQGVQTLMAEAKSEDQQALFGQLEYDLGASLKGVVAARVDKSTLHDTQFSPKGSLVWSVHPNHTLRLTYNEAFQVANYSEFFLQAPTVLPGTTVSSLNLSAIENALRPLLGGVSLGFGRIPVYALGNEDLDVEKIRSYELGYNAVLGRKAYLTFDYYQSKIENFITDLLPNLSAAGRTNPNFGPYAPPSSLPAPVQAAILGALRANLPPTLFPFLSNDANGAPIVALASYTNAGKVDTQGIDVGLNYYVGNAWVVDFSYSWFDFDIKEQRVGDQLLPNAPENKWNAGLTYNGDRFGGSIKYRWVDGFPWAAGLFQGPVPSYDVVDLAASYRFSDRWELGLDVSNLLDDEHWESFGGDLLSRRALAHVSFTW